MKTFTESPNTIEVFDEADILIVGGGCAGHAAAIAAARAGAKNIVILERYGYMGGDVTGGYVIMVPNLTWRNKSYVRGIQEEWFSRLEKIPGAVLGPGLDEIGSESPVLIDRWSAIHDCVSRCEEVPKRVVRAVYFEPNQLKIEMDKMVLEHKDSIRLYYHCWGTKPIMEGNQIKGVIFESKEGRKAVMAKVVIDASGDGDIYSQAGAPYSDCKDEGTRVSTTALVYRIGGVDVNAYDDWKRKRPEAALALRGELSKVAGFRSLPLPTNQNDMVWINNWLPNKNCIDVKDLTATEVSVRDTIRDVIECLRKYVPLAFKDAYLYDIAPQTGVRCSRRLEGEYKMTPADFAFHKEFDDVIAWHSTICRINDSAPVEIPYRVMVPQMVENLLCPGRHISADEVAIDWLLLIPQCVGTGQAAGVAAAVSLQNGTSVRNVDIKQVQDILVDQDVPLPRHPKTDPSLTAVLEEHNYGLYTELASSAKENYEEFLKYRQW